MKTTKTNFNYFKKRCEYWIEALGLKAYDVGYFHEPDSSGYGRTHARPEHSVASIILATEWPEGIWPGLTMDEFLDKLALHEIIHILLEPLNNRFITQDDWNARNEHVARTLQKTIMESHK